MAARPAVACLLVLLPLVSAAADGDAPSTQGATAGMTAPFRPFGSEPLRDYGTLALSFLVRDGVRSA